MMDQGTVSPERDAENKQIFWNAVFAQDPERCAPGALRVAAAAQAFRCDDYETQRDANSAMHNLMQSCASAVIAQHARIVALKAQVAAQHEIAQDHHAQRMKIEAAGKAQLEAVGAGGVSGRLVSKADELPAAWMHYHPELAPEGDPWPGQIDEQDKLAGWSERPLYAQLAQPLQQSAPVRAPLTDAKISKWWSSENGLEDCDMCVYNDFLEVVRAVEAKHHITGKVEGAQP